MSSKCGNSAENIFDVDTHRARISMYRQLERPDLQCSSLYPVLRAPLYVCDVNVVSALDKNLVLVVVSMYDTLNSSDASP